MTYTLQYINEYGKSIMFSVDSGFVLASLDGATENNIDITNTQGINLVGGTPQGQSIQPRIIAASGTIMGLSAAGKKQMIDTILPGVNATLVYDGIWQIEVLPKRTPSISSHKWNAEFDFLLEAAYPYWRKSDSATTALAQIMPSFKFPWNLTKSWSFGKRTESQLINVPNDGNVLAGFEVVFYATAAVSNPSLTKAETLECIKINRTMTAGEKVSIKNMPNYVKVSSTIGEITTDIFNDLDFESDMFLLSVGDNVLRFDADQNRDGLLVHINHATTSVGAYSEKDL